MSKTGERAALPVAVLKTVTLGYHVLITPDGQEIGGTSKAALARYGRAYGWIVKTVEYVRPSKLATDINGNNW